MSRSRRNFSAEFKTNLVLQLLKGEKELNTEQTMSKKQNGVLVTAPHFGTGRETVGEFPGYSCGYCQGNGYFQGDITVKDTELVPCPKCGGTGKVKGIVTVDWVPDGEVKPCLKGNSNNI